MAVSISAKGLTNQMVVCRSQGELFDKRIVYSSLMLFMVLVAQLIIRLRIIDVGYEIEQARAAVVARDAQLRSMQSELHSFERPQLLRERAAKELGMQKLTPHTLRLIPSNVAASGEHVVVKG